MDPQPHPPPQPSPSSTPPLSASAAPIPASTPSSATTATSGVPTAAAAAAYPDSIDSSPRYRTTETFYDEPPPLSSKLRLMCSYGGRIVPRPHDKFLCYVGGDTRMVVVDRQASLSSLSSKLSTTLLNGRPFTLKYQLPSEDLDSLISVTTDEDLDNMIDEYDRTSTGATSNSSKPSRLRLFLFPVKPDSSQSIGPILENSAAKDEWFLNALNGATTELLNRGFSDSASVNCLLGLDDHANNHLDFVGSGGGGGGGGSAGRVGVRDGEGLNKNGKQGQDVHSVPDSPLLETTSSFGSTSSSPSLANLPPIRVHVEDGAGGVRGVAQDQQKVGIEEQFAQISVGNGGGLNADEGFMIISSPPPIPVSITVSGVPVGSPVMGGGGYQNRIISDDERSDHGVPVEYRRPPPQQSQPQTQQQRSTGGGSGGGASDLPSPDSMSSDSSFSNAMNRQQQKPGINQEQQVMQIPPGANRVVASNLVDPNTTLVQVQQQLQDSGNLLLAQFEQQQHQQQQLQYTHAGGHYIQHHPSGAVQIPAYYPVYTQQQQQHIHQMDHHQQYPVYYVQARQPQAYNLQPVQQPQSGIGEPANNGSGLQTPPTVSPMVPQPLAIAGYNPVRNAAVPKPEMMYRTTNTGTPQLIALSSSGQQQYVGYPQVHHHSTQSMAPAAASAGNPGYGYEFVDSGHGHGPIYYTQPLAPSMQPCQYQTMTTSGGGVVLPEGSGQIPAEPMKQQQQQQIRTSQPL